MMTERPLETVPMVKSDECSCGSGRTCGAVRHIEDLSAEVDTLRAELRKCERQHAEDNRKLWYKIGGVMVALAAVLPTGWAGFLGLI